MLSHCCSNYPFPWLQGRFFFFFELPQYLEEFLTCIMHFLYIGWLIVSPEFPCLFIPFYTFLRLYLAEMFTCPNGGHLLLGTCEYSKFIPSIHFNNWLIQKVPFIKICSASAFFFFFFGLFVNPKRLRVILAAIILPWALSYNMRFLSLFSPQDREEGAIIVVTLKFV